MFNFSFLIGALVQGCDNYITFARYAVVNPQVSNTHKYLAIAYVLVFLYGSWWQWFTIAPAFHDMSGDDGYILVTYSNSYVNFPSYVLYDFFYTILLLIEVYKVKNAAVVSSSAEALEVLAYKAIIHNLLSIAGVGFYAYLVPIGILIQNIFIVTALHFLFNWRSSTSIIKRFTVMSSRNGGAKSQNSHVSRSQNSTNNPPANSKHSFSSFSRRFKQRLSELSSSSKRAGTGGKVLPAPTTNSPAVGAGNYTDLGSVKEGDAFQEGDILNMNLELSILTKDEKVDDEVQGDGAGV